MHYGRKNSSPHLGRTYVRIVERQYELESLRRSFAMLRVGAPGAGPGGRPGRREGATGPGEGDPAPTGRYAAPARPGFGHLNIRTTITGALCVIPHISET